eukprot:Rmarinus@m.8988
MVFCIFCGKGCSQGSFCWNCGAPLMKTSIIDGVQHNMTEIELDGSKYKKRFIWGEETEVLLLEAVRHIANVALQTGEKVSNYPDLVAKYFSVIDISGATEIVVRNRIKKRDVFGIQIRDLFVRHFGANTYSIDAPTFAKLEAVLEAIPQSVLQLRFREILEQQPVT